MSKFFIINLIDKIFITCAVFLIVFAWINFYLQNIRLSFFLSLIFSFSIIFILFYFWNKKNNKTKSLKEKAENIEKYFFAFKTLSKKRQYQLMFTILSKTTPCQVKCDCLTFKKNDKSSVIKTYSNYTISQNFLFEILSETNEYFDELFIICENVSDGLNLNIFKNKKIHIIDKTNLYEDYFEQYKIFPNLENLNYEKVKPNFKYLMKNFIQPKKAKSYFCCGLLLIFSGFIIPMKTYYFVLGSLLLLFAIMCKLKKYNFHIFHSTHDTKN